MTNEKSNRKELLEALSFIKPGIATGSTIDQSDLVLMDNDRIVSFNDEIAISHPYKINHTGGVGATELQKMLQKIPTDEIEIGEKENELVIKYGDNEAGFNIVKDVTIPDLGIGDIETWIELPADFCHGISFCLHSASTDHSKGILVCINCKSDKIYSCDNFRATRYDLKDPLPDEIELNIPRNAAKELSIYEPVEVSFNDNWIHFRNETGTIFSCRTIAGEYLDVAQLFDISGCESKKIPLPIELKQSLSRAEILAGEDQKSQGKVVNIEIAKGKIICKGQGLNGRVTEKIKIDFDDEIPNFMINPVLLNQILDMVQEAVLTDRVLLFEGSGAAHVMPLLGK